MLELQDVSVGYHSGKKEKTVFSSLSVTVAEGELLCILGANGVGKTTLYKTILGFLPILKGQILINGTDVNKCSRRELARQIAYVPQYHIPPFPYTVREVVLMGRGVHISEFSKPSKQDEIIAGQMLERMGIMHLQNCVYTEISGGERQLVLIARALAQQTPFLLMDEPTSNLDYGNQMRLLREIARLAKEGIGICYTSHYPEHALLNHSNILALLPDNQYKKGSSSILTEELIQKMYGLEVGIYEVQNKKGQMGQVILPEF